jgi:hypothetical protein
MTKALSPLSPGLTFTILGIVLAFCLLDYGISRYCYKEIIWGETCLAAAHPVNSPYWKLSKAQQKEHAVKAWEAYWEWQKWELDRRRNAMRP